MITEILVTIIIALSAGTLTMHAMETEDSVKTSVLDELVVESSRRSLRGDTLTVVPTARQIKNNRNGYELLRALQLPGLRVNTFSSELLTGENLSVTVLIDGRPAAKMDILALRPTNIAYVEFLQPPGAEYGFDDSIGAVINFHTKEPQDGYALGMMLNNAVTTLNGQNFIYGKYNNGNSELSLAFVSQYTSLNKRRINQTSQYILPSDTFSIVRSGLNTHLAYTQNTIQLAYNFFKPDEHILNVSFMGTIYHSPDRAHKQYVEETGDEPYYQLTSPYEKYLNPTLDLYYKRIFSKSRYIGPCAKVRGRGQPKILQHRYRYE